MTLGEKIKKKRLEKKLTQRQLCKEKITRNMLSAIESGKANPSLETLEYISHELDLPLSYLLSEDEDLYYYEKKKYIDEIHRLFREKKFRSCIGCVNKISEIDDELAYILAICNFELCKRAVIGGSLSSGEKYLTAFRDYADRTLYDTSMQQNLSLLYSALIANFQSPLLEMDSKRFEKSLSEDFGLDFYKYLCADKDYKQNNLQFKTHLLAKEHINNRKYKDALKLMLDMIENKSMGAHNAYLLFSVYTDIEFCYKQLLDFENAYKYASKRLSIIEGFKL